MTQDTNDSKPIEGQPVYIVAAEMDGYQRVIAWRADRNEALRCKHALEAYQAAKPVEPCMATMNSAEYAKARDQKAVWLAQHPVGRNAHHCKGYTIDEIPWVSPADLLSPR